MSGPHVGNIVAVLGLNLLLNVEPRERLKLCEFSKYQRNGILYSLIWIFDQILTIDAEDVQRLACGCAQSSPLDPEALVCLWPRFDNEYRGDLQSNVLHYDQTAMPRRPRTTGVAVHPTRPKRGRWPPLPHRVSARGQRGTARRALPLLTDEWQAVFDGQRHFSSNTDMSGP